MTITAAQSIPLIGLHRSPQLIGAVMRLCVLEQDQLCQGYSTRVDNSSATSLSRPCRSIPWHLYRPIGGLPR